jgi:spermidine/putrescine transport system permease protein
MATSMAFGEMDAAVREEPVERKVKTNWVRRLLGVYSILAILYVLFPIFIIILYGFNQSHTLLPQVVFKWQGFTLQWYREWNQIPGLTSAFWLSLRLALANTICSTIIGTLMALALVRYKFRGKGANEQVMFMAIASPEIVLGASLLGFFITLKIIPLGFPTLLIAHIMFSIAFVAITVRARLSGFDRSLEEAAQDLFASPWVTFTRVTLPLIWPGIMAGALMAFLLSIDDFIISYFVSGSRITYPIWIYGSSRVGLPPQVLVLGTIIFVFGLSLALIGQGWQAAKNRPSKGIAAP